MISDSFTQNTLLLTGASLLMSGIDMGYHAWLARSLGAAGLGLHQLTLSVSALCATLAISGIRFASTRLVAEELGAGRSGAHSAMGRCLAYAAFCGFCALLLLRLLAEPLGFLWIGDARTVLSLRIAALSMPCISLCAALSGYYTACGVVWKPVLAHLAEAMTGVGLSVLLLERTPPGDLEQRCAALMLARAAADLLSLLLLAVFFLRDRRRHPEAEEGGRYSARLLRLALPLAFSAYTRSALTTLRQLLVPRGLRASGLSADTALAGYGVIQGMVLPLLFFPACLLASAAELIVPVLTAAQVQNDRRKIKNTAGRLLRLSLQYSLAVSGILFLCADLLGGLLFHSREAARFLRMLAPLAPVMYLDMAVDGCLKGLGQQLWSMGVNVLEASLGLLLLLLLLPRRGLCAYVAVLYFCEGVNLALSLIRLLPCLRASDGGARHPCEGSAKCAYTAGR